MGLLKGLTNRSKLADVFEYEGRIAQQMAVTLKQL